MSLLIGVRVSLQDHMIRRVDAQQLQLEFRAFLETRLPGAENCYGSGIDLERSPTENKPWDDLSEHKLKIWVQPFKYGEMLKKQGYIYTSIYLIIVDFVFQKMRLVDNYIELETFWSG